MTGTAPLDSSGIELRHLRALLVLAEELHFGRAAARLYVSQSTLSRTIADLEALMGVPLVVRSHRTVELTAAGRTLVASAEAAVREVNDGIEAARHVDVRRVVVGVLGFVAVRLVTAARSELAGDDLSIESRVIRFSEGLDPLRGAVELAVVPIPLLPQPGIRSRVLARSRLWFALPEDHPLADRSEVALADVIDEPVIHPPAHPLWHENFDVMCRAQGLTPRRGASPPSLVETMALVAAGEGWAMASGRSTFQAWDGVVLLPATGVPDVEIGAMWQDGRLSAGGAAVLDALLAAAVRGERSEALVSAA